jgi:serine/threonine-protein kinase
VYFVMTGRAPFGDGPAEMILAQQLSDTLPARLQDDGFPEALGDWLLRGLAAPVEDRFADALEMRIAWRQVVRAMRRAEDQRPWWRRLIDGIQEDEPVEPPAGW